MGVLVWCLDRLKHAAPAMVAMMVLLSAACGGSDRLTASRQSDPRSLWAKCAGRSYIVEQRRICFCPFIRGAVHLTVVGETVVRGVDVNTGDTLGATELKQYKSVGKLFEFVETAQTFEADVLEVGYDPIFGYPERIYLDPRIGALDDEILYSTRLVRFLSR